MSSLVMAEKNLANLALHNNDHEAIEKLRDMGNAGLQVLLQEYRKSPLATQKQQQMFDVIDRVAGQKHAVFSGLYWHTDLRAAKKVAAQEGKPILLLRLLGRLDEEFC